jgi:hypothetical protein
VSSGIGRIVLSVHQEGSGLGGMFKDGWQISEIRSKERGVTEMKNAQVPPHFFCWLTPRGGVGVMMGGWVCWVLDAHITPFICFRN